MTEYVSGETNAIPEQFPAVLASLGEFIQSLNHEWSTVSGDHAFGRIIDVAFGLKPESLSALAPLKGRE